MDKEQQGRALQFSIIDGALSAIMGSLAGGIFLVGFALKVLKAQPAALSTKRTIRTIYVSSSATDFALG